MMMESGPAKVQDSARATSLDLAPVSAPLQKKGYNRWTEEEKTILTTDWLAGHPIEEIAKKIGRSYGEVAIKAHRLNLPKRKNRPRDLQFAPVIDFSAIEKEDIPKVVAKLAPNCKGPCGKPFKPAHSMQRICNKCREAIRQMCI
jgi:hypothetical protein